MLLLRRDGWRCRYGGMGSGSGVPGGVMGGIGTAPAPVVKVAPPKGPQRVSSGVISGLAISQPSRSIRRSHEQRTSQVRWFCTQ